jgi:peptidoglycan LD-endopeptidase LytH
VLPSLAHRLLELALTGQKRNRTDIAEVNCMARLRTCAAALVLVVVSTGCETRDSAEVTSREADEIPGAIIDSETTVIDSSISAPAPLDVDADAETPLATTSVWDSISLASMPPAPDPAPAATDTASQPTTLELAVLSASLEVPVSGVARSELRDTYAEARTGHVHHAIDILAPRGTPVVSATAGRLLKLFNSKAGGIMVYATDTSERFILLYGHLDRYADGLSNGMLLARGQLIGYVGTTGNAPPGTPHLHFGILRGNPVKSWSRGTPVNPYLLFVPAKPSR